MAKTNTALKFGDLKKPRSEAEVTRSIRDTLDILNIPNRKIWQGPMSDLGIADLICVLPPSGRILAIEVKKEGWKPPLSGGKPYKHYLRQKKYIDEVNRAGGIAFFADSEDVVIDKLGVRDRFLF